MYCGEGTLVKYGGPAAFAVTLRCKSWGCETCNPRRQRQLRGMAAGGRPDKFITLTADPSKFASPEQAAAALARGWRLIVKRIKRTWPNNRIEYLCVFEAHKSGWPHLHILARSKFIPQRWLSAAAAEILQSPIVDIRAVKSPRMAAYYVAKYVGKAPGHFGTSKRYWHTKLWTNKQDAKTHWIKMFAGTWIRSRRDIWRWAVQLERFGYLCWWDDDGSLAGWRDTPLVRGPPAAELL